MPEATLHFVATARLQFAGHLRETLDGIKKTNMDFDIIYKVAHILVLAISAYFVLSTIIKNQEWNRRKTTHEFINELVFGEYPELSKILTVDLGVKIYDKTEDYLRSFEKLNSEKEKDKFRYTVSKIFNLFEVLSISLKNNVIDESICYDYLGYMYTEYYRWGIDYIKSTRQESGEPRILINFENCALKWQQRINDELTYKQVKGKRPL